MFDERSKIHHPEKVHLLSLRKVEGKKRAIAKQEVEKNPQNFNPQNLN